MDGRGSSAGFLICKIGIAFAAIAFIGFVFSVCSGSARFVEEQELDLLADKIIGTIEKLERFPDESELCVELPLSGRLFKVLISGGLDDGLQLLQVGVTSEVSVERSLILKTIVNGGDFSLLMDNPHDFIARKDGDIYVELV